MVEDDRDIDIETDGDDEVNGRVRIRRVPVRNVALSHRPADRITQELSFFSFSYSYYYHIILVKLLCLAFSTLQCLTIN